MPLTDEQYESLNNYERRELLRQSTLRHLPVNRDSVNQIYDRLIEYLNRKGNKNIHLHWEMHYPETYRIMKRLGAIK